MHDLAAVDARDLCVPMQTQTHGMARGYGSNACLFHASRMVHALFTTAQRSDAAAGPGGDGTLLAAIGIARRYSRDEVYRNSPASATHIQAVQNTLSSLVATNTLEYIFTNILIAESALPEHAEQDAAHIAASGVFPEGNLYDMVRACVTIVRGILSTTNIFGFADILGRKYRDAHYAVPRKIRLETSNVRVSDMRERCRFAAAQLYGLVHGIGEVNRTFTDARWGGARMTMQNLPVCTLDVLGDTGGGAGVAFSDAISSNEFPRLSADYVPDSQGKTAIKMLTDDFFRKMGEEASVEHTRLLHDLANSYTDARYAEFLAYRYALHTRYTMWMFRGEMAAAKEVAPDDEYDVTPRGVQRAALETVASDRIYHRFTLLYTALMRLQSAVFTAFKRLLGAYFGKVLVCKLFPQTIAACEHLFPLFVSTPFEPEGGRAARSAPTLVSLILDDPRIRDSEYAWITNNKGCVRRHWAHDSIPRNVLKYTDFGETGVIIDRACLNHVHGGLYPRISSALYNTISPFLDPHAHLRGMVPPSCFFRSVLLWRQTRVLSRQASVFSRASDERAESKYKIAGDPVSLDIEDGPSELRVIFNRSSRALAQLLHDANSTAVSRHVGQTVAFGSTMDVVAAMLETVHVLGHAAAGVPFTTHFGFRQTFAFRLAARLAASRAACTDTERARLAFVTESFDRMVDAGEDRAAIDEAWARLETRPKHARATAGGATAGGGRAGARNETNVHICRTAALLYIPDIDAGVLETEAGEVPAGAGGDEACAAVRGWLDRHVRHGVFVVVDTHNNTDPSEELDEKLRGARHVFASLAKQKNAGALIVIDRAAYSTQEQWLESAADTLLRIMLARRSDVIRQLSEYLDEVLVVVGERYRRCIDERALSGAGGGAKTELEVELERILGETLSEINHDAQAPIYVPNSFLPQSVAPVAASPAEAQEKYAAYLRYTKSLHSAHNELCVDEGHGDRACAQLRALFSDVIQKEMRAMRRSLELAGYYADTACCKL